MNDVSVLFSETGILNLFICLLNVVLFFHFFFFCCCFVRFLFFVVVVVVVVVVICLLLNCFLSEMFVIHTFYKFDFNCFLFFLFFLPV